MKIPCATRIGGLAIAAMLLAFSTSAHAQILTNGDFEAGFAGWTRADQVGSEGTFFLQTGATSPVNAFPVPAPPQGTQAAMTDAQGGGSHVLYQDFVVPTVVGSASVSFSLFINNAADAFRTPATLDWATATLNQQVRVDIITTSANPFSVASGDVLQNLYQSLTTDPLVSGYTFFSRDTTALFQARAGQTLRLRFAEVDNVGPLNLGVDQVSVTASASAAPEPCSLLLVGGTVGFIGMARRRSAQFQKPSPG